MNFEIPTMKLALQVWWAFLWRSLLAALFAGIVIGVLLGIIMGIVAIATGLNMETLKAVSTLLGGILGLYVSVWILHRMMTVGFGKYRLVVTKK